MARTKKATAKVEEVRPYVEGVAKNLVDKLYGPAGLPWGVTLTEREDVCLGVRAVLTEKMLEAALERQAADHPRRPSEFGACPGCHRPLDCDDVEALYGFGFVAVTSSRTVRLQGPNSSNPRREPWQS